MRRPRRRPATALRARSGIRCFVAPSPARDSVDNGVILPRLRRGGGAGEDRAFGEGSGAATLTLAFSEDFDVPATLAASPAPLPAPPPVV